MSRWLQKEIVHVLDKLGKKICKKFGYQYSNIKRLHPNDGEDRTTVQGYITVDKKEIRISLKKTKTRFHSMQDLVDTLVHEIAHIKDTDNTVEDKHDAAWKERYGEMKKWTRKYIYD